MPKDTRKHNAKKPMFYRKKKSESDSESDEEPTTKSHGKTLMVGMPQPSTNPLHRTKGGKHTRKHRGRSYRKFTRRH